MKALITANDGVGGHEPDLNALAAFVDRRLDAPDRARIVEHLGTCARCRAIVAQLVRPDARPEASRRAHAALLPLAASVALAAVGGGLYWLARERVPEPAAALPSPPPADAPAAAEPTRVPSLDGPLGTAARGDTSTGAAPQTDRTRAVGVRTVGGKTFRLVAGEWVDGDYRAIDFLPVVEIPTRDDLDAHPALRPFVALGSRFIVVVDGTVYRVALRPPQP